MDHAEKLDALIDAQMDIVRNWQKVTLASTAKGKEVMGDDPLWHDLRMSLSLAVDKLATLRGLKT